MTYDNRIENGVPTPRRPAHRPSRRSAVINAAMGLFSSFPVDEVTVFDIAGTVGMTPAAVYYHFASKEQILLEGLRDFQQLLLAEVKANMPVKGDRDGVANLIDHVSAWSRRNRTFATVYFVNSVGLNQLVEALRRDTRLELVELFGQAAKAARGRLGAAETGVIGVALVSMLETAIASNLSQDGVYRGLGARRFQDEVRSLSYKVAGIAS